MVTSRDGRVRHVDRNAFRRDRRRVVGGEGRLGRSVDRGEQCGSECAADLQGGVDQGTGSAGVVVGDTDQCEVLHRHHQQTQSEAEDREAGEHVRPVGAVYLDLGQHEQSYCCHQRAGDHERLGADLGGQLRCDGRRQDDEERHRQRSDAGHDRAESEHDLQVERQVQRAAEQGGAHQHGADQSSAAITMPRNAQR